ncbi:Gfo/Idh/MocA family oxidoreductase [Candidatus Bathyarchaeota archaeon]|nr:Gfo/Idh/MocA family oxidoreductase [Candidatus Bathyarchaeota archaeon]
MRKVRMAVVGAGFWGKNHVRVLSELPNAEIIAVCDIDKQRADTISEKYGIKSYDDSLEMYRREELDAVTICVWSSRLAEEALKALGFGKHVLVEKPMASSISDAKKVLRTAKEKKLKLAVGFIERFNPGVRRVKKAIENGLIGTPVLATAKRVSKWPQRIGDVGVIKDAAIHDIDIMRFLFDEEPISVYARAGSLQHKFEDYAQIILAFPGDKTAFLETNWLTPYKIRKLTITGSEAIINLDYITQEISIDSSRQTLIPRHEWREPLKLELQHFVECIMEDREPLASGVDGVKALKIAEAALKSASSGRVIRV